MEFVKGIEWYVKEQVACTSGGTNYVFTVRCLWMLMACVVHVVRYDYEANQEPKNTRQYTRREKMTCSEICKKYEVRNFNQGMYFQGNKRCQVCQIYLKWDGLWCPCCNMRLRSKPRAKKFKEIMRAKNGL